MKQKKKIFWKVYWVFVIIALIAIAITLYVLYRFLVVYENAQPFYKMDEVLDMFQDNRISELLDYETAEYDKKYRSDIEEVFSEKIQGKEITYKQKYGEYSPTNPVYCVYADDENVATVYLCADEERGDFDSKIWNLEKITGMVEQLEDIEITAPDNMIIEVNGETLTSDEVVSSAAIEDRSHYDGFISNFPKMVTYHVGNIYRIPEVKCYAAASGIEIPLESGGYPAYTYGLNRSETLTLEKKAEIDEFVSRYTKYGLGDAGFSAIKDYFVPDTPTYARMQMIAWMEKNKRDRIEISEVRIADYVVYNPNAYMVTLDYNYAIYWENIYKEYPTLLTVYYAVVDGEWKIVEMYVNSNYE